MKKILLALLLIPAFSFSQDVDAFWREQQEKEKKEKEEAESLKVLFTKDSTGLYEFKEVVKIDNASDKLLFSRAKLFIAEMYKSAKDVTQLTDETSNTLIAKAAIINDYSTALVNNFRVIVNYQLKIEAKENRYRYTVSGFSVKPFGYQNVILALEEDKPKGLPKKLWLTIKRDVHKDITKLIADLKVSMQKNNDDF